MPQVGARGIEGEEVYLTNVPLTQFVLNGWIIINTGSVFLWKEVMIALFILLSQHLYGDAEKNNEKPQSV
jgi:hypothetical protein